MGGILSTVGGILSTVGDVQYLGGYHNKCWEYLEYRGGGQITKIVSPKVLNTSTVLRYPPRYS